MPISREFVVATYQVLLGRLPESEDVIRHHQTTADEDTFLSAVLSGLEFRMKRPKAQKSSHAWVWADPGESFILRVNLADGAVGWHVIEGQFEKNETAFIKRIMKPGSTAIDIGANVGFFSMLMASLVGPMGKVYSFEPLPHLCGSLLLSATRNRYNDIITAYNVALSDRAGSAWLSYAKETTNWGGAHIGEAATSIQGHESIAVPLYTLDSLLNGKRVDFIKIDVEGAEPLAIRGALGTIGKYKPTILSEIHPAMLQRVSSATPHDYVRLLTELGYECRKLQGGGELGPTYTGDSDDALVNVVFIPPQ